MAKDMSPFLKSFAGNMAQGLAGMAGVPGTGAMTNMFGGSGVEDNPGMRMFKGNNEGVPAANEPNFGQRFLQNMQEQLFKNSLMNSMRNGGF